MYRSITVVLQPTARQRQALERLFDVQREVYNAALEVLAFGVTVCRGTLTRLDEAFNGFYRRVKARRKAGYPRFQGWATCPSSAPGDTLRVGQRR